VALVCMAMAESFPPAPLQAAKYCVACGNGLVVTAAICPRCGTPVAGTRFGRQAKSRAVAVVLAVFLSFWSFLYTYSISAWKFWLGLLLNVLAAGTIWIVVATLGHGTPVNLIFVTIPVGVWVWAIVDRSVTQL
jgi:predicted amidophosphoribosyltransferase